MTHTRQRKQPAALACLCGTLEAQACRFHSLNEVVRIRRARLGDNLQAHINSLAGALPLASFRSRNCVPVYAHPWQFSALIVQQHDHTTI